MDLIFSNGFELRELLTRENRKGFSLPCKLSFKLSLQVICDWIVTRRGKRESTESRERKERRRKFRKRLRANPLQVQFGRVFGGFSCGNQARFADEKSVINCAVIGERITEKDCIFKCLEKSQENRIASQRADQVKREFFHWKASQKRFSRRCKLFPPLFARFPKIVLSLSLFPV